MTSHERAQVLGPGALNLLQECLDTLLASHDLGRDTEDANLIAVALIEAHRRGVTDKAELIRLADPRSDGHSVN
jgi:hypothetical protein